MKISSTILACFSATHGFNTGKKVGHKESGHTERFFARTNIRIEVDVICRSYSASHELWPMIVHFYLRKREVLIQFRNHSPIFIP